MGVDTCGRIAAFWGFTRTMGRIFGLLYLSPEPLARAEIQRRLAISVGNASMTLGALQRWGVVHRARVKGRRADHFTAETDFWKMISRVLDERERREIATAVAIVEAAKAQVAKASARGGDERRKEAAFVSDRLGRLHDICALGQTMLDMLLGQLKLDVGRFRDVLRVP
jgi:DNA-binding transcriptional regulator GbsR (MarR family)